MSHRGKLKPFTVIVHLYNRLNLKFFFILVIGLLCIIGNTALGTHETDHRFTVFGIIKNSSGIPQSNLKVMVTDTLTGEGNTVFTDQRGYYEVLLHLHNNNLGDEIRITAGPIVQSIKATFNPEDKHTERKTEVNLEVSQKPIEQGSKGWSIAAGILFLGGFLFVFRTFYFQRKLAK